MVPIVVLLNAAEVENRGFSRLDNGYLNERHSCCLFWSRNRRVAVDLRITVFIVLQDMGHSKDGING